MVKARKPSINFLQLALFQDMGINAISEKNFHQKRYKYLKPVLKF